MKLTDLILELPGFLPEEDCESFVEKFWNNANKHHDGGIGDGDVDYTHKKATQWHPQVGNDIWCQLSVVVDNAIDEYYKRSKLLWRAPLVSYDYSLRCYVKNDGWFNEHIDVSPMDPLLMSRLYAIIVYLDDVAEGGETEFVELGYKVKPEMGKLLMFPCNQLYPHKGNKPISNGKHVFTAFVCMDIDAPHLKAAQHPNQMHGCPYQKHWGKK